MVFNDKNFWTFKRFNNNTGTKIFHKVAKSVENRIKSNDPEKEIPLHASEDKASIESLIPHSKASPIKSDKIEKSVHFNMELENHRAVPMNQSVKLCKVKIYVTPCIGIATLVDVNGKKQEIPKENVNGRSYCNDSYKSAISFQEISGSSTYLTAEDTSGINENLEDMVEVEEPLDQTDDGIVITMKQTLSSVFEEVAEAKIVRSQIEEEHEVSTTKQLLRQDAEDAKTNFSDVSGHRNNCEENSKPVEFHLNDLEGRGTNEGSCNTQFKKNSDADVVKQIQCHEYANDSFCNVSRQVNSNDDDAVTTSVPASARDEFALFQPDFNEIDIENRNGKASTEERGSLVKNMIKLFNEDLSKNSSHQQNCRDALNEINGYPWNLVRQRIDQFSNEQVQNDDANIDGYNTKNQADVSQSLVQRRIQQLLADANMVKIFNVPSSEFVTNVTKDRQVMDKNSMAESVQNEIEQCPEAKDFYCSSNHMTFIKNLQFLLDSHETSDESDSNSHSFQFSDSLENSVEYFEENSPSFLRRSNGVQDLSHLENCKNYNLGVYDLGDCESEVISFSGDGEKNYLQVVGYARAQSSPSNATPSHYEQIREGETESTGDYLTPVDDKASMSQESAAQRSQEISKKFVVNLFESSQRNCVSLKKPADYKIIHSENELHIKNMEVIGDKEHVNYGIINKHTSESDNGISRRVDSVNVGGNNCISVEIPVKFCRGNVSLEEVSDTESDSQANGEVEMEENIYAVPNGLAEDDDEKKKSKSDDEIYFVLKHEADIQGIIMQQASKALEICRNSRQFLGGRELIEAERILLVATHKYDLLRKEIQKAKYDSFQPRNDHAIGNVTINNLFLPLQLNEEDFTRYNYYFVLLLSNQDKLFATKVIEGNSMNYANFEDEFTFRDLSSDFVITIDIYGLNVKKFEDKNRLSKKFKTKNKLENLSPKKKLFYKDIQTFTLTETSVTQSSFSLCGSVVIRLEDINRSSCPIRNACRSIISNTMNLNTSVSDVRIRCKKSGFLTVGSEVNGHLAWNRRWCVLDGSILKFFNYPGDEDLIDPVIALNFEHCCAGEIEICDKERCAKSRTMLLKTRLMVNGAFESVGHFLSADSRQDLLDWQSKINSIVEALVNWNQLSLDN